MGSFLCTVRGGGGGGERKGEGGEGRGSRRKRRRRDLSFLSFSAGSRIAIQLQARMSSCNKVELKKGKENMLFFSLTNEVQRFCLLK